MSHVACCKCGEPAPYTEYAELVVGSINAQRRRNGKEPLEPSQLVPCDTCGAEMQEEQRVKQEQRRQAEAAQVKAPKANAKPRGSDVVGFGDRKPAPDSSSRDLFRKFLK